MPAIFNPNEPFVEESAAPRFDPSQPFVDETEAEAPLPTPERGVSMFEPREDLTQFQRPFQIGETSEPIQPFVVEPTAEQAAYLSGARPDPYGIRDTEFARQLFSKLPSDIGQALDVAGQTLYGGGVKALEHGISEFQPEQVAAEPEQSVEEMVSGLPPVQRAFTKGIKGIVESSPRLAIYAFDPALGVLSFGMTPEGFDPMQAGIAAAAPFVGRYTGPITETIARGAGVKKDVALVVWNKLGGATGAAGVLGAPQVAEILSLPEEERKDAWIDWAGNIGTIMALGAMGKRHKDIPEGPVKDFARKLATKKVSERYSPDQVRDMYDRFASGKPVTPLESEIMRGMNDAFPELGKAVKKARGSGITLTEATPRFENKALNDLLGIGKPTKTITIGGQDARSIIKATEIHGDLLPLAGQGPGEMPPAKGVPGIQPQTPAGVQPTRQNAERGKIGNGFEVATPDREYTVSGEWEVIDSKMARRSDQPGYFEAYQDRSKTGESLESRAQKIVRNFQAESLGESPISSHGSPIIDTAGDTITGNARRRAIEIMYESGRGDEYRTWLNQEAQRHGIDPKSFEGYPRPELVRRVTDYKTLTEKHGNRAPIELARLSNVSDVNALREAEQARSDVTALLNNPEILTRFNPAEDGDVLSSGNQTFLQHFFKAIGEPQNLRTKDGWNPGAMERRVKNAMLTLMVGREHESLVGKLIEAPEDIGKNIVIGLIQASPRFIDLRLRSPLYDPSQPIAKALNTLLTLRGKGKIENAIDTYLGQNEMFGDAERTGESDAWLEYLGKSKTNREVSERLNAFVNTANQELANANQAGGLFGEPVRTRQQIIEALRNEFLKRKPTAEQPNLPTGKPSEVPKQPKSSQKPEVPVAPEPPKPAPADDIAAYEAAWKAVNDPKSGPEALTLIDRLNKIGDAKATDKLNFRKTGAGQDPTKPIRLQLNTVQWSDGTWSYRYHWDTEWHTGGVLYFGRFNTRAEALADGFSALRQEIQDRSRPYSGGKTLKGIDKNNKTLLEQLSQWEKSVQEQPPAAPASPFAPEFKEHERIFYYFKTGGGRNAGWIATYGGLPSETIRHRGYDVAVASRPPTPDELQKIRTDKRHSIITYETLDKLLNDESNVIGSGKEFEALKEKLVKRLPPSEWPKYGVSNAAFLREHGIDPDTGKPIEKPSAPIPKGERVRFVDGNGKIQTGIVDVPADKPGGLVRVLVDSEFEGITRPTHIMEANLIREGKAAPPEPQFKPGQNVIVGELQQPGTIAAHGPFKGGEHWYFVNTALGREVPVREADLKPGGLEKPAAPTPPAAPGKRLIDDSQAKKLRDRIKKKLQEPPEEGFLEALGIEGKVEGAEEPKPKKAKLDPQTFNDAVQLGADYIQTGYHKYPDFASKMVEDFGPEITDHLKSIYENAKLALESPSGEAGGLTRPPGLQPGLRPPEQRVITARKEFTKPSDESVIPKELLPHLDPHQRQGAASAIASLSDPNPDNRGFLNAGGAGVGKTRQVLTVAKKYADENFKVLIVTKAETFSPDWKKSTFGGSYYNDAKAMGVKLRLARSGMVFPGDIGITTYENLKDVAAHTDNRTVLIFDESHALKNDSLRGKRGLRAIAKAHGVMFMSATPADKAPHIHYLARIGMLEGNSYVDQMKSLGMVLVERDAIVEDDFGNRHRKKVKYLANDPGVSDEQRQERLQALFNRMTDKGKMIKQEVSMEGTHVQVFQLPMPPEAHQLQTDILNLALKVYKKDTFDDLTGLHKAIVLGHQRRQQEPFKIAPAVMLTKREIAAGRQVVIFVQRINESEVGFNEKVKDMFGNVEKVRHVLMSSEGTAKTLREALHEAGIHDIAEIHGNADQTSLEAMADFQSGKKRVVIATPESGATGINLDDIRGNQPRSMIVMTAPFDAVTNVQAAGRIWRLKTLSGSNYYYLFGDTPVDAWNADIIGSKMKMLGSVVEGQVRKLDITNPDLVSLDDFWKKPDTGAGAAPRGEVFPDLEWKPTTYGNKFFATLPTGDATSKAFWAWYNAHGKGQNPLGVRVMKNKEGQWMVMADKIPEKASPPAEPEEGDVESGMYPVPEEAAMSGYFRMPTEPSGTGPMTRASDIIDTMAEAMDRPIRIGAVTVRDALGIFKVHDQIARIKRANDIPTAAHEMAHMLERVHRLALGGGKTKVHRNAWYGTMSPLAKVEFKNLDYDPSKKRIYEGWAEFMRHYLTIGGTQTRYPAAHKWFVDTFLKDNPALGPKLESILKSVTAFQNQGAVNELKSMIRFTGQEKPEKMRDKAKAAYHTIRRIFEDDIYDLERVERAILGGETAYGAKSPSKIARTVTQKSAAIAREWGLRGMTDIAGNKVGLSLAEIFEKPGIKGDEENALAYTIARRALNRIRRGVDVGFDPETLRRAIPALETPERQQFAKDITEFSDNALQYLVDSGVISGGTKEAMREIDPIYIQFMRVFEKERGGGAGGRRIGDQPRPIKPMKGGEGREIKDPIESMAAQMERFISIANKTRVARALVNLVESKEGFGKFVTEYPADKVPFEFTIDRIKNELKKAGADLSKADLEQTITLFMNSPRTPQGGNIVGFWKDGKRKFYEIDPELYRVIMALDFQRLHPVVDAVLGKLARVTRLGATGINPGFALWTNTVRDLGTLMAQSKFNPAEGIRKWAEHLARQVGLQETEIKDLWRATGGEITQPLGLDRQSIHQFRQEVLANSGKRILYNILRHPWEATREVFSITEAAPRLAEFEMSLRKSGWKPGQPLTEDQAIEAAHDAAESTVNFSRGGSFGRMWNQIVAFHNPNIQGLSKFGRAHRRNPKGSAFRGLAFISSIAIANWIANKDDEEWKDLPAWLKYGFLNWKIGNTWIRIPMPWEWWFIYGALPIAALESINNKSGGDLSKMATVTGKAVTPPFAPSAAVPIIEVMANRSFHTGKPIESARMKRLVTTERQQPYTTESAKAVSQVLSSGGVNVSPVEVDHIIRGESGGLATELIKIAEKSTGLAKESVIREPADIPVIGRLFIRSGESSMIDEMYDVLEHLEQKKATFEQYNRVGSPRAEKYRLTPEELPQLYSLRRANLRMTALRKEFKEAPDINRRRELMAEMQALAKLAIDQESE